MRARTTPSVALSYPFLSPNPRFPWTSPLLRLLLRRVPHYARSDTTTCTTAVPRNHVLPYALLQHDHVPGRLLLPRRDGGTDRVSCGVPMSPGELRARGLHAGHVLSGRLREYDVVSAGVARQPDLEQHAGVERRGVRRGGTGCHYFFFSSTFSSRRPFRHARAHKQVCHVNSWSDERAV